MTILIISSSLTETSTPITLSQAASEVLTTHSIKHNHIILKDFPLPLCGTPESFNNKHAKALETRIQEASGIILSTPIYNYNCNAVAKNMIELTGSAWKHKCVGFLCAAGGEKSYMSIMPIANSLMLDFRCLIIPSFVYASSQDVRKGTIHNPDIIKRIETLALYMHRINTALSTS